MGSILPLLLAGLGGISGFIGLYALKHRKGPGRNRKSNKKSDHYSSLLKSAVRKIKKTPRSADALRVLAEHSYNTGDYSQAFSHYRVLSDLCATTPGLDEFDIVIRQGICALQTNCVNEAKRCFAYAVTFNRDSFELFHHFGVLTCNEKRYKSALTLLKKAHRLDPHHTDNAKYLGKCALKLGLDTEAMEALRSLMENGGIDKGSQLTLAQLHFKLSRYADALKLAAPLRTDSEVGASASLIAGVIHMRQKAYRKAIEQLRSGLEQKHIDHKTKRETQYLLAQAYLAENELENAVSLLKELHSLYPDYRDVGALLQSNREICENNSLKRYLFASIPEFVVLCRKLATTYFAQSQTSIRAIQSEEKGIVDVSADVLMRMWQETVLFRFIRSDQFLGELCVAEFHANMKDEGVGRGVLFSAGAFNDKAREFVKARMIDLVEKKELLKLFGAAELT